MKDSSLKLLAIVFFVVLALALFFSFKKDPLDSNEAILEKSSVNLAKIEKDKIAKIKIKNAEISLEFVRDGEVWKLDGEEIDKVKMDAFLAELEDSKVMSLASKNKEKHGEFELTEENAIILTIVEGEEEKVFLVGRQAYGLSDFFIRKKGVVNVYVVKSEIRDRLLWESDKWMEQEPEESEDSVDSGVLDLEDSGDEADLPSF